MVTVRKGVSTDVTAALLLFAALILTVLVISFMTRSGLTESKNLENEYTAQRADIAMQKIIEGFEKTATFFGIMGAAKELGEHGGVSSSAAAAAGTYQPIMDAPGGVASWTAARCDNTAGIPTSTIRKRVPFVFYEDPNMQVNAAESLISLNSILNNPTYSQSVQDVIAGGYRFNLLANIFMRKSGTVEVNVCAINCPDASCSVSCLPTPITISESMGVMISFGNDIMTSDINELYLTVMGSSDDVAVLRTVAVSIYSGSVVRDPSNTLYNKVNAYPKPATIGDLTTRINTITASFAPTSRGIYESLDSNEGFARGILWVPDKVYAYTPEVRASGFGVTEEENQIRYFRMREFAEFFVDNYEAWVEPRWWNRLNTFDDLSDPVKGTACQVVGGNPTYANACPPDPITYPEDAFRVAINQDLANIANDLSNQFSPIGIRWTITVPDSQFTGCNILSTPAEVLASCVTAPNMEYFQYKSGKFHTYAKCNSVTKPHSCGSYENAAWSCDTANQCIMKYDHRYILKNVPIYVTITDEKYKTFDSTAMTWAPYSFTFAVEIDRVDDNTCHFCDGLCRYEECSTQDRPVTIAYPMVEPPVSVPDELLYTCERVSGQTCEAGASCPGGKVKATGTCAAGETCCEPSTALPKCGDLGGTCYLLGACPAATPVMVPKASISDCQAISQVCCKPGALPSCELTDAFLGGCPPGTKSCSTADCVEIPFLNKFCCEPI